MCENLTKTVWSFCLHFLRKLICLFFHFKEGQFCLLINKITCIFIFFFQGFTDFTTASTDVLMVNPQIFTLIIQSKKKIFVLGLLLLSYFLFKLKSCMVTGALLEILWDMYTHILKVQTYGNSRKNASNV